MKQTKSSPAKLAYMKKYHALNRERDNARTNKWYHENQFDTLAQQKEYNRLHPEVNKTASEKYRKKNQSNPEWLARKAEHARNARAADPEKAKAVSLKAAKKRYAKFFHVKDSPFRLALMLRNSLRRRLKSQNAKKAASTFDLIGCSIEQLKEHLQRQFKPGMAWNNYGYRGWHIDHIIPISSFDLLDPDQQRAAFNYQNLQPLWAAENLAKSDKFA